MKKIIIGMSAFLFFCGFAATGYAVEVESLGVDIHGFISQGFLQSTDYNYLANDTKKGSFQFNEMGVNFSKQVMNNLRIGTQFFARDLGDVSNNKITVDWAYGDYHFKDWLGIRVGKIKMPLGLYGDIRDMDMLRPCIVLPQGIYPDLIRDSMIAMNGAALYGDIPMSVAGRLQYHLQTGQVNDDPDSGVEKAIVGGLGYPGGKVGSFNSEISYVEALRWTTPLSGLTLKGTFYQTENDIPLSIGTFALPLNNITKYQIYSAEYIWRNLTLTAEYQTTSSKNTALGTSSEGRGESYYGMASYRFTNWLEAGAYYSEYYPKASDKSGDELTAQGKPDYYAWQKDSAAFVRLDINNNMILKLEGHYVDGVSDVQPGDNLTMTDKNWWYFAAKASFSF